MLKLSMTNAEIKGVILFCVQVLFVYNLGSLLVRYIKFYYFLLFSDKTLIVTFNLLELKVISLWHQYWVSQDRLHVHISVQSDQALYCWLTNLDILKIIIDSSKFRRYIILFKKFNRIRVNIMLFFIHVSYRRWD